MNPPRRCRHLRTKIMFIPALAENAPEPNPEEPAHSSHCWCNCTLTETGPDDRPVATFDCSLGRSCFED